LAESDSFVTQQTRHDVTLLYGWSVTFMECGTANQMGDFFP